LSQFKSHIWEWKGFQISWTCNKPSHQSNISTLLIHGFGACKEHWRFNQSILGSIAPCYAIDLIGFGASSQPIATLKGEEKGQNHFDYCFENWSELIQEFCNEVIKTPVLLIGNSIGGVIALKAAQLLKKNCHSIVLIDCAQRTMDDKRLAEQPFISQLMRPLLKNLVRQRWLSQTIFNSVAQPFFIKSILQVAYPTKNNLNESLIEMLYRPTQRIGASEGFRGFINLFDDYLAPELMKDLQIPVDLIWGEKDPWEPLENAKTWFSSLSCIRSLEVIKDSGHCPHDEYPELVNPILIKIIQQAI
tara:strand:+ start:16863 stop:17774 length:912 start_codon:yes stop_codon:yes gene_type:complete